MTDILSAMQCTKKHNRIRTDTPLTDNWISLNDGLLYLRECANHVTTLSNQCQSQRLYSIVGQLNDLYSTVLYRSILCLTVLYCSALH